MRNIVKGTEPKSLEQHRHSAIASYASYEDKQSLRQALVNEQRGLCCYCLSRIIADDSKMKIEHWQSQISSPDRQLHYPNLLGACRGGEGKPRHLQHCDTRKGDQMFSMNPADPNHDVERPLHYDRDGCIRSTDPAFDREINEVLNLNAPILKQNRKSVLLRFINYPKKGNWSDNWLEKKLAEWSGDSDVGNLEEYCQVIVYWLRKRLQRS